MGTSIHLHLYPPRILHYTAVPRSSKSTGSMIPPQSLSNSVPLPAYQILRIPPIFKIPCLEIDIDKFLHYQLSSGRSALFVQFISSQYALSRPSCSVAFVALIVIRYAIPLSFPIAASNQHAGLATTISFKS